jgi:MSHA pilin protein MshD
MAASGMPHRQQQRRPRLQRGLALVEAVIAIAIVAIAATVILAQVSQANSVSGRSVVQAEAAAIGAAYLTEILGRPFADPDGIDGETLRSQFDDVDDYDGLSDAVARDASGNTLPGGDRYQVNVVVSAAGGLPGVPAADAKLVSVTVTDPVGATVVTSGLRLR